MLLLCLRSELPLRVNDTRLLELFLRSTGIVGGVGMLSRLTPNRCCAVATRSLQTQEKDVRLSESTVPKMGIAAPSFGRLAVQMDVHRVPPR